MTAETGTGQLRIPFQFLRISHTILHTPCFVQLQACDLVRSEIVSSGQFVQSDCTNVERLIAKGAATLILRIDDLARVESKLAFGTYRSTRLGDVGPGGCFSLVRLSCGSASSLQRQLEVIDTIMGKAVQCFQK